MGSRKGGALELCAAWVGGDISTRRGGRHKAQDAGEAVLGHSPGAKQFFLGKQLIPGCDGMRSVPQVPYLCGERWHRRPLPYRGAAKALGQHV